ncbi:MAG: aspartyl protease family protein, partial [Candidatus Neomarinimicrobiota bacterium]
MKRINRSLIRSLILLLAFTGCSQIKMIQKFNSGQPVYGSDVCTIPFKLIGHKILVSVNINEEKQSYNFLLDTGALTFINKTTAGDIGLKKGAEMPTMNKNEKAYLTKLDSIALGEMKVKDFVVPIMDIQAVFDSSFSVDGFIGSDFLRFFCTVIDYENRIIILRRNNDKQDTSAVGYIVNLQSPFPLRFPTIKLKINNYQEIDGIIDTGSPFSLVLPLSFTDEFDDSARKQLVKSRGAIAQWPSTKADYNYLWRVQKLELGELELTNLPVIFAELPNQLKTALIGKDLLDKFLIT